MMKNHTLHIKNMVCPRCVTAVKNALQNLDISWKNVELGQIVLTEPLPIEKQKKLGEELQTIGFELLETKKSALISQIKTLIIEQIHYSKEPLTVNFSTFLSEELYYDYSYMSRLFSSVEGITIEKFIAHQKIEKVKELLFYDEQNLSEIALQMDYSSVAYLSTQFKKETGMTPTEFKKSHEPGHRHLDSI